MRRKQLLKPLNVSAEKRRAPEMHAELLESDWARRLNKVNRDIFPGSGSLLLRLFVGLPATLRAGDAEVVSEQNASLLQSSVRPAAATAPNLAHTSKTEFPVSGMCG